jgi:hypothetical protein
VQTSVGSTTRADTKSLGSASSQPVTTPALAALVGGANASAVVDSASQAQAPLPANLPAQRTTSAAGARGAPLFGLLGRSAWARPAWAAALMALPSFGSALGARASAGFGGGFLWGAVLPRSTSLALACLFLTGLGRPQA